MHGCSLKIYKYQLVRDNKLPEDASSTSTATTGEHGTATATGESNSNAEHPATSSGESSGTEHGTTSKASETASAAHETTVESAHNKAKRAILMVSNEYVHQDTADYNPMEMAQQINEQQQAQNYSHWPSTSDHWTTWCKYLAASLVTGTLQMISSGGAIDNISSDYSTTSNNHHLMRRSEPTTEGEASFTDTMTIAENVFVYKTFLIFAGIILVINSLIKALNTRISGKSIFYNDCKLYTQMPHLDRFVW